jgi:hypothetical protein
MEKSFFAALIDSSFTTFITRRVATVLYLILMVLIAIFALVVLVAGLSLVSSDGLMGLLLAVSGPLGGLVALILIRLGFESAVALVLVAENTSKGKSNK